MGMIGKSAPAALNPQALSPQERMMLLGATLQDAGAGLRGGSGGAVMGTMGYLAQRQMLGNLMASMAQDRAGAQAATGLAGAPPADGSQPTGLAGPAPGPDQGGAAPAAAPPASTASGPMFSPRTLALMSFVAPQAATALTNVQKLNKNAVGPNGQVYGEYDPGVRGQNLSASEYLNGFKVNPNDPSSPNYVPSPPVEGAMPIRTASGVDWYLPPGAERALDAKNKAALMRGQAALAEVPIAARNANTQAAAQANTASQNTAAPPPGFVVRPRRR